MHISHKNHAMLGFEQKLWAAADKLRGHVDPSEYKHLVLGLIFLKYISETFERKCAELLKKNTQAKLSHIFWVPPHARWNHLLAHSSHDNIGQVLDKAMQSIEQENPVLKNVLPHDYARHGLDKRQLAGLIELISTIPLGSGHHNKDILGRVYEYFIGHFASLEGRGKGEFYTPPSIVRLMVEMIEPYRGKIYDPCCGSGGMFVQSEKFVLAHGGNSNDIRIYGQESNYTTWRLCKMNLAIHGLSGDIGNHNADCFHRDLHESLKANYVLANPPFNISDWGGAQLQRDTRWYYGAPPAGNANYAWIQHILHHLAADGTAAIILANATATSRQQGENIIRKKLIEADVVDCVLALPRQLFYSTPISACIWFLVHDKKSSHYRARAGEVLFIDAQHFGHVTERTHRIFSENDIDTLSALYKNWRSRAPFKKYEDIPELCRAASLSQIAAEGYILSPHRYVGTKTTDIVRSGDSLEQIRSLSMQLQKECQNRHTLEQQVIEGLQRFFHAS